MDADDDKDDEIALNDDTVVAEDLYRDDEVEAVDDNILLLEGLIIDCCCRA